MKKLHILIHTHRFGITTAVFYADKDMTTHINGEDNPATDEELELIKMLQLNYEADDYGEFIDIKCHDGEIENFSTYSDSKDAALALNCEPIEAYISIAGKANVNNVNIGDITLERDGRSLTIDITDSGWEIENNTNITCKVVILEDNGLTVEDLYSDDLVATIHLGGEEQPIEVQVATLRLDVMGTEKVVSLKIDY